MANVDALIHRVLLTKLTVSCSMATFTLLFTVISTLLLIRLIQSQSSICDTDISPNTDTCLQIHTWKLCADSWMQDYCCITCGYISCLDTCYDGDINNVPPERLSPYNCTTDISPNSNTCPELASWGLCSADWVYGHCCSSCPEACKCDLTPQPTSTTTTTNNPSNTNSNITTSTNLIITSIATSTLPANTESLCDSDISPNDKDTCLDFYTWNQCDQTWMTDKCCKTCGYVSCLDSCYDGDINNVPQERLTPFNCSSDISPNDYDTCPEFKEWGECNAEWMQNKGHCCKSCPNACNCPYNSVVTTSTETPELTHNNTNCTHDIPPPADEGAEQSSCLSQYRWDNCDKSWMKGYCCLTCGFESCLNECYNGDIDNIPFSRYYPNPYNCTSNEPPPPPDNAGDDYINPKCEQQAKDNNCDEWWMDGYCCYNCPESCLCDEFDWNNLSYIITDEDERNGGNDGLYQRLTWEEIKFWERTYISMHCILLFVILMIPLFILIQRVCDKRKYLMVGDLSKTKESMGESKGREKRKNDATQSHTRLGVPADSAKSESKEREQKKHDRQISGLTMSTQTHCHIVNADDDDDISGDHSGNDLEVINNNNNNGSRDENDGLTPTATPEPVDNINNNLPEFNRYLTPNSLKEKKSMDSYPNTPSLQNVPSSSYTKKSTSRNSSKLMSKTSSRSVGGGRRIEKKEKESKELKYFKLLAFICIFLWTLRILVEIIAMLIWYYDTELATNIAKPWDSFRMLIYVIAKMLMYISFICRIYYSFKGSAYQYSKWFIIILIIILLIDVSFRIIVHILKIYEYSGDIVDRNNDKNNLKINEFIFYGLMFLVIEEILYTLVLVIAFIKPLFVISKNILTENMLDMMSKYVVLGYFCIISSLLISIFHIFYINTNDLFIIWTTSLLLSFDCVINGWCTILLFKFTNKWYNKICPICHNCIKFMYIKKFKSQGIQLTNIKS